MATVVEFVTRDGVAVEVVEEFWSEAGNTAFRITGRNGTELVPGTELVFETIDGSELESRLSDWWDDQAETIKQQFSPSYWAKQWKQAGTTKKHALNAGIVATMSPEEQDTRRDQNRRTIMLATAHDLLAASPSVAAALKVRSEAIEESEPVEESIAEEPIHVVVEEVPEPANDEIPVKITVKSNTPDEAFNVTPGTSGADLFSRLGLTETQWYQHAEELLSRFPQDFQRGATGMVTLSHNGWLATETIRVINGWRNA